ncbi:putative outer membrane lipoprotein [Legionella steelei]|uniref:Putative outer membrane lipoprotein n=2 Tax=Legionella TaxID=445 RepID=A0A0W0S991_9GAMM|nr:MULTISPECIES: DUF4156 domain-containing protein [Legionella]KTC80172.1 putative outer membrane lipoprotein [Legionella cherrii]KTD71764.1 putative outer membrane lipoprotein [Legionella steelei]
MRKKTSYCLLVTLLVGLSSCSKNVALTSEGAQIKVVKAGKLSRSCQYLDKISAYDVNGVSQSYQSHEHLYQDELNILKNKSALLGANTLMITQHQSLFTGNPKTHLVDRHGLEGKAYRCKQ